MPLSRRSRHLELVPDASAIAGAPAPATFRAPVADETAAVDVVILTSDAELLAAARDAIGDHHRSSHARSAEEVADLLINGRCGVLLLDTASVSSRVDTLIEQIVDQFPDVVVCVAGTRADEPLLARLISEGLVERFMHKPASARRAGMFLQAAIRRHHERRGGSDRDTWVPLLRTLARPGKGLSPKYLGILAAVALALTVPLYFGGVPESPFVPTAMRRSVPSADVAGEPSVEVVSSRSDPVLSRARAALDAGRLESPPGRNALDLYRAVLLAEPGHAEARAGLARTIDGLLERADAAAATGRKEEAERLVQRVLDAAPGHEAARALATRLDPPDTPSQQLSREQVAEALAAEQAALPPMPPLPKTPVPDTGFTGFSETPKTPPKRRPIVQRDPLSPHYVNEPSDRIDTLTRPRHYGGTPATRLPTAGMAGSGTTSLPGGEPTPAEPETAEPTLAEPATSDATTPATEAARLN